MNYSIKAYRGLVREFQCEGKRRFPTGLQALAIRLDWLKRHPELDEFDFSVYPCRFCRGWHIGTLKHGMVFRDYTESVPETDQQTLFRISAKNQIIGWNDDRYSATKYPNLNGSERRKLKKQRHRANKKARNEQKANARKSDTGLPESERMESERPS